MAQYLKSLVTGVVLPYSEPALKCADYRKMSVQECEEYEASLGKRAKAKPAVKAKAAKPKPVAKPAVAKPAVAEVLVEDFDPDVEEVLGALEAD